MANDKNEKLSELNCVIGKEELDSLKSLNAKNEVNSDIDFIDFNIKSHMEDYTSILKEYTRNLSDINKDKRRNKKIMFWLSFVILALVSLAIIIYPIIFICLQQVFELDLINYISFIMPIVVSFVSAYLVIPEIITTYLFNKDEDKYMSDIVINTQKLDNNLYQKRSNEDISSIEK